MEVNGQLHAPAALLLGKEPMVSTVWVDQNWSGHGGKKTLLCPSQELKPVHPVHRLVTTLTELPRL